MLRAALIGNPLRRTHSAVMHNAAFAHFGVDATYELVELQPSQLDGFFAEARGTDWLGFQVTAPFKQEAAARCDAVEDSAQRIGAVNSVLRLADGSLLGFNTDAGGFARAVRLDLGRELGGAVVAVAGAGGAARAVIHACLEADARRVVVGARTTAAAERLATERGDPRLVPSSLGDDFVEALTVSDLAVNATTVGMTSPGAAFDPAALASGAAVFDLVYVPAETPLVSRARTRGLDAVNGLGMLVAQAEIAFQRWTGIADAGPIMRQALAESTLTDGP